MSAFSQPTSRYCSNGYLINCTDALEFIVGLTGVCKLRKPPKMESLDNCTDTCLQASSVQPTLNSSLSFWVHCTNAFTLSIVGSSGACSWLGLLWAHCTDECNLPSAGSTGDSKLPLSWSFRPDFFGVLYLFIPWTYKPDKDRLNTYISSSVVCVINRQNIILKYGMRGHFRYTYQEILHDSNPWWEDSFQSNH